MKLYDYERLQEALTDVLRGQELRDALDAISELEPTAVVRDCNGCMGASFADCCTCEKVKLNEVAV